MEVIKSINMITNVIERKRLFHNPIDSSLTHFYQPRRDAYPELDLFKSQIDVKDSGLQRKPYHAEKTQIFMYRTIFFSLGVLYFFLALVLYTKSLTWTCTVLFGNCFLLKTFLLTLCGTSSIYCIAFGFLIKAEKEAVKKVFSQAKSRLRRAYENKSLKYGINKFLDFNDEYKKSTALKEHYYDALEKLHDHKEQTLHILERISIKKNLDSEEREQLYNQAILECKDGLDLLIHQFKSANS